MLTTEQIKNRTKTVTRRLGWKNLKRGDILQGCVKCQGLKKGEKLQKLAVIRVKFVDFEPLLNITKEDVAKEGFPEMSEWQFVKMFCQEMRCEPERAVTRIEFEYL